MSYPHKHLIPAHGDPAFEKYTADLAARPASQRANQINEDRIKSLED
ncbi:MAG: hypothetical protein IIC59_05560 [Proteobacteria bacterium]|nr:hypothetical protein [Pseudomonadota bacterium]MCH8174636.1 hypothetical protein [Pseudomonadota bacterium]